MSCYSCHARLIQSRGMTDSEIPFPLLYDNSIKPTRRNEAVLDSEIPVPLLYDNSIKPTWRNEAVLMATEKRPMDTNESTERTILARQGRQYQPPEESVGLRPGKLSQYVPTLPYSVLNTYNPPGISVSPVSNGYVSNYPTP